MMTFDNLARSAEEPFTLTAAQIEALQALPPGIYLVCSRCRLLRTGTSITMPDVGTWLCDPCARGL